jgi:hypothetical protein
MRERKVSLSTGPPITNILSIRFDFWCFNATFSNISVISQSSRLTFYLTGPPDLKVQIFIGPPSILQALIVGLTTRTSLAPIWCGFAPGFVNYKKGCTRLTATSDKVYQLLAQGRWFKIQIQILPQSVLAYQNSKHDDVPKSIMH